MEFRRRKVTHLALLLTSIVCLTTDPSLAQRRGAGDFQSQSEENWRPNPPFFEARTDQQRCAALELWFSSMRQGATKNRRYQRGTGDVMNGVESQDIMKYAAPAFHDVFGKDFIELTEGERKQIAKSLKRCSSEPWVEAILVMAFTQSVDSPQIRAWAREFERYKNAKQLIAKPREPRVSVDARPGLSNQDRDWNQSYEAGELLLETDLFRLHARAGRTGCNPSQQAGGAALVLVFKVDDNYEIKNNEPYWRLFEEQVMPAALRWCSPVSQISIANHIAGRFISPDAVFDQPQTRSLSLPISRATYSFRNPSGSSQRFWVGFDYVRLRGPDAPASIALLRTAFEQKRVDQAAYEVRTQNQLRERDAERQRQNDAQREARIAAKREPHRAKAAPILQLLKRGAAERFDFSGYRQRQILESVYTGDFDLFTAGYVSEDLTPGKIVSGMLLGNTADMSEMSAIARARAAIVIPYFTYHEIYEEKCRSNRELEWVEARFRTDTEYYSRSSPFFPIRVVEGRTYYYKVREPFADQFLESYRAANDSGFLNFYLRLGTNLKQELEDDFRKFLTEAGGCSSPTVRQFEINLYLASEWMLPLQELLPQTQARVAPRNYRQIDVAGHTRTDVTVRRNETVQISAFGAVTLGLYAGSTSPDGASGSALEPYNLIPNARHGALLVRIQQPRGGGEWTPCGSQCSFTADRDGTLEFTINDRDTANNGGRFIVRIRQDSR